MNRSSDIYTAKVKVMFAAASDASCSQAPGENGYHSELNHFSTGCLLML